MFGDYKKELEKFAGPDKAKIKVLTSDEYSKKTKDITVSDSDKVYYVQLNPNKITLTDGVSYSDTTRDNKRVFMDTGERRMPISMYSQHNARELSIELLFDTYTSLKTETDKADVKEDFIDEFVKLITNPGENKTPPLVFFSWGSIQFKGVITKMNTNYTLFTSKGVPVRATMNLTIKEYFF